MSARTKQAIHPKQPKQPIHPYERLRRQLHAYEKGDRDCLRGDYSPPTSAEERNVYDLAWWLAQSNREPIAPWM